MPIIYSFVASGSVVIAEYTAYTGNFHVVALECLQKINVDQPRFTLLCDRHNFNFLNQDGFVYLAVSDEGYGRQIPFAFLEKVRNEFMERYRGQQGNLMAHSLDKDFGPRLKSHIDYCTAHPEEIDKMTSIKQKVGDVKNLMMENIEKVLERGDKIELLVDKTDQLSNQAEQFQKTGRQLRNKIWKENLKMKLYVMGAFALLGIFVWLIACGGFSCSSSSGDSEGSGRHKVFL
eukprot:gene10752-17834_t